MSAGRRCATGCGPSGPAAVAREKIIAFLHSEPDRTWSAKELSRLLGDITVQSIYRQLSRLADRGLVIKVGPAAYTLPTP